MRFFPQFRSTLPFCVASICLCALPLRAADLPAGGGAILRGWNTNSLLLSGFIDAGSTSAVSEVQIIDDDGGTIRRKIPIDLEWSELTIARHVDHRLDLWQWRDRVIADPQSAKADISITILDFQGMELRRDHYTRAWPHSIKAAMPATGGPATETAIITHEGKLGISVDPMVSMTTPAAHTVFWNPTNLSIQATALMSNAIDGLQFYSGATLIGNAMESPPGNFALLWTNPPAGDHTLSAIATDVFGSDYASKNVVPISIRYGLTYDAWRLTSGYFVGKALSNPAISGPFADPDKDRVPNLLEYAAGTNPNSELDFPKVQLMRGLDGLWFTYRRRSGGIATGFHQYQYADARYVVETSTDLVTWTPAAASFTQISVPIIRNQVFETASLRIGTGAAAATVRYFRLRVDLLP